MPEKSDKPPTAQNSRNVWVIVKFNNFLNSGKIAKNQHSTTTAIKKSSALTATYVPGILNKGNFGYKGINTKSAKTPQNKYFLQSSDNLSISFGPFFLTQTKKCKNS